MKWCVFFAALAGCSYGGYQPDYDSLKERLHKDPAFLQGPHGSSSELANRLSSLFEREPSPDLTGSVPLEDLVRFALAKNPELRAALKRLEAAIEAVPQAASAPAPELEIGAMTDLHDLFENILEWTVKVMQELLFPGKLRAQTHFALENAAEVSEQTRELALQLRLDVALRAGRLHETDHALRIVRESRKLVDQLALVARARYEAGQVPEQDVLKIRVQALQLERRDIELARRRRESEAELNALLGRRDLSAFGSAAFDESIAEPAALDGLLARAFQHRPDVAAMTHRLRRELEGVRLAELEWWPDLSPSVMADLRPGRDDDFAIGLSMHLSFLRPAKRAAAERQSRAALGEAAHMFEARLNEIARDVAAGHARAVETARSATLFRERLVPEARKTYESALASYRAGAVDFDTVIGSLMTALDTEIELHRLVADHLVARESLRRAVGEKP